MVIKIPLCEVKADLLYHPSTGQYFELGSEYSIIAEGPKLIRVEHADVDRTPVATFPCKAEVTIDSDSNAFVKSLDGTTWRFKLLNYSNAY